jgi:hypothetical protein
MPPAISRINDLRLRLRSSSINPPLCQHGDTLTVQLLIAREAQSRQC